MMTSATDLRCLSLFTPTAELGPHTGVALPTGASWIIRVGLRARPRGGSFPLVAQVPAMHYPGHATRLSQTYCRERRPLQHPTIPFPGMCARMMDVPG